MAKCLWSACVALFILGPGSFESASLAKPPDLPVELGVDFDDSDCPNTISLGFDLLSGKLSVNFTMPWNLVLPWQPAPKDPTTIRFKAPSNAIHLPRATTVGDDQGQESLQQAQARALFATAERCLKNGDIDMARTCYEEAHLLAPQSRVGRQAIQRLGDIDNAQTSPVTGPAEEQEPRAPAVPRD